MCNFKITNPVETDLNDVMYLRLEHFARCKPILFKGESLQNPIAMYQLNKGQDYTALRGINFYLLFISNSESSGDFVFRIWFNSVNGLGKEDPKEVTWEKEPQNAAEIGIIEPNVTEPTSTTSDTDNSTTPVTPTPTDVVDTSDSQETIGGDDAGGIQDEPEEEVKEETVNDPETEPEVTEEVGKEVGEEVVEEVMEEEETKTDKDTGKDDTLLDNVIIDVSDDEKEPIPSLKSFSVSYLAHLRAYGFTEEEITRLEAATYNTESAGNEDSSSNNKITIDDANKEEGLSMGVKIMISALGTLFFLPIMIWLILNVIAKYCHNSKLGRRFNEWKATRALSDEQKQLRDFQKQKMQFVNTKSVSDEDF